MWYRGLELSKLFIKEFTRKKRILLQTIALDKDVEYELCQCAGMDVIVGHMTTSQSLIKIL